MVKRIWLKIIVLLLGVAVAVPVIGLSTTLLYQKAYPRSYQDLVEQYAQAYGVDPSLVFGIIDVYKRQGSERGCRSRCRQNSRRVLGGWRPQG